MDCDGGTTQGTEHEPSLASLFLRIRFDGLRRSPLKTFDPGSIMFQLIRRHDFVDLPRYGLGIMTLNYRGKTSANNNRIVPPCQL
jgi:hypothetical protein